MQPLSILTLELRAEATAARAHPHDHLLAETATVNLTILTLTEMIDEAMIVATTEIVLSPLEVDVILLQDTAMPDHPHGIKEQQPVPMANPRFCPWTKASWA